jgi:hypothetical protein
MDEIWVDARRLLGSRFGNELKPAAASRGLESSVQVPDKEATKRSHMLFARGV